MALPAFRYRIDSLRVDGDVSADPRDYKGWPQGEVVGAELHAYCTAELDPKLAVRDGSTSRRKTERWAIPFAVLLVRGPTVADLERWRKVKYVTMGCGSMPSPCS